MWIMCQFIKSCWQWSAAVSHELLVGTNMMHSPWPYLDRFFCSCFSWFFSFQKYRVDMPGSNSAFIPTINAITTSQDLQWMVQPTVITSMSNPYSRTHPYGHHLTNGPGLLGHNTLPRPGVIRSIGDARGRRKRDEQVRDLWRAFKRLITVHALRGRVGTRFQSTSDSSASVWLYLNGVLVWLLTLPALFFLYLSSAHPRGRRKEEGEAWEEQVGCRQMPQPQARAHRDATRGE